ncbi:MAG TPA: hypothetical protein PLP83_02530 [Candidatus Aminicenantes bacterium]|nr:hypothetical protein [Candidatus Aminicenantes bacterium]
MSEVVYICSVCGKRAKAKKGAPVPLCCHKEMGPLPYCTEQPHPEMARNYDEDLPCDDGTVPKADWPREKGPKK